MSSPYLPFILIPYFRWELPGWGRLMRLSGVHDDSRWVDAPIKRIRGKFHGYRMTLDLANWSERTTYILGRFYDLATQLLLRALLRPGDTVIDAGANIGMITLLAARCVGPTGCVLSFEPNPDAFRRLAAAVEENDLSGIVHPFPLALSDTEGDAILSVVTEHTGMGTLASVPREDQDLVSRSHRVRMVRGDEVLSALKDPVTIKIDVEGYECHVLRGLARTLEAHHPMVITEVVADHLTRAGSNVSTLLDLMHAGGYRGFGLGTIRSGLRHRLSLTALDSRTLPRMNDVVWIAEDSPFHDRLHQAERTGQFHRLRADSSSWTPEDSDAADVSSR